MDGSSIFGALLDDFGCFLVIVVLNIYHFSNFSVGQ
jgi:hypothetical protein